MPTNLLVYANEAAFREAQKPLPLDAMMENRGRSLSDLLIVQVPETTATTITTSVRKRTFSKEFSILDQLQALPVAAAQAQFPPFGKDTVYFFRKETALLWQVIKKLLPTVGKRRIVMVGSPGVGKSCLLVLVGFYLACVEKKKVLLIRRVKEGNMKNAVVDLDGQGSFAQTTNVSRRDLEDLRNHRTLCGAYVLVDGYSQDEVNTPDELEPFHFLAMSYQYDAKHDDPSHVVVLPAWQREDLEQYARLINWVISAGFRKNKSLKDSTWRKLVNEQYFYSGGSLREFCKARDELTRRVVADCNPIGDAQEAYHLVVTYGRKYRNTDHVNRVRRHYVTDRNNEDHYSNTAHWKLSMDAGFALTYLARKVSMAKQLEVFKYAASIGAGFLGTAYELFFHHAVHEAHTNKTPVVLKMSSGSYYDRIQICAPRVECSGKKEEQCFTRLANLSERTYWYPDYPFFPGIDAVAICDAFPRGSNHPETIVAYIQLTIRNEKTFKPHRLRALNDAMDTNPNIADDKRVFVVVGPDATICETFTLHGAPNPEAFPTMVGCFDPTETRLNDRT